MISSRVRLFGMAGIAFVAGVGLEIAWKHASRNEIAPLQPYALAKATDVEIMVGLLRAIDNGRCIDARSALEIHLKSAIRELKMIQPDPRLPPDQSEIIGKSLMDGENYLDSGRATIGEGK